MVIHEPSPPSHRKTKTPYDWPWSAPLPLQCKHKVSSKVFALSFSWQIVEFAEMLSPQPQALQKSMQHFPLFLPPRQISALEPKFACRCVLMPICLLLTLKVMTITPFDYVIPLPAGTSKNRIQAFLIVSIFINLFRKMTKYSIVWNRSPEMIL